MCNFLKGSAPCALILCETAFEGRAVFREERGVSSFFFSLIDSLCHVSGAKFTSEFVVVAKGPRRRIHRREFPLSSFG